MNAISALPAAVCMHVVLAGWVASVCWRHRCWRSEAVLPSASPPETPEPPACPAERPSSGTCATCAPCSTP